MEYIVLKFKSIITLHEAIPESWKHLTLPKKDKNLYNIQFDEEKKERERENNKRQKEG